MKREIKEYVINILFMVGVILGSYPLWSAIESRTPDFSHFRLTGLALGELKPIGANVISTEEEADPGVLIVRNPLATTSSSNLFLKFNRESTLDYRKLSVKLNDEVVDLDNVLMTMDDTYYIFMLTDITLPGYSDREIVMSLWIDPNQDDIYNKLFDYRIELG